MVVVKPVGYNYSQNAVYTIIYEIVKVKLSQRKLVMNKKCNGAIYRFFFNLQLKILIMQTDPADCFCVFVRQ